MTTSFCRSMIGKPAKPQCDKYCEERENENERKRTIKKSRKTMRNQKSRMRIKKRKGVRKDQL